MKKIFKFLLFIIFICSYNCISANNNKEYKLRKSSEETLLPTATISGGASVCLNGPSQAITFTGSGGTAPYTFTYKLNGGADQTIVSTGDIATLSVSSAIAGIFNYTLVSVTDAVNDSQLQNGTAVITVTVLPAANVGTNNALCTGTSVTLGSTGVPGHTYLWTANNSAFTSTLPNPVVSPAVTTIYTLTETNTVTGCTKQNTINVTVHPLPVAGFNVPAATNCSTQAVAFTNTSTGSNLVYAWNFGNPSSGSNNTSDQIHPSHTFIPDPGNGTQTFTVTLTITNSVTLCEDTETHQVTVKQLPDPTLTGTGTSLFDGQPIFKLCNNNASQFTFINASSTTATNINYTIDWGDNSTDFSSTSWMSATHTYPIGFYVLTYTVTGQNNCTVTKTYNVFVGLNPAVSLGNPGNTDICNQNSLTFPITGTENNPPGTTYIITFNDGSAPLQYTQANLPGTITHFFPSSSCGTTSSNGTTTYQNSFSANITAINPCGESSVGVVPIRVSTPPNGEFVLQENATCVNVPVCITNTTTGAFQIDGSVCSGSPKIVWSISPSAGVTLTSGSYGNTFGMIDPDLWIGGSQEICPKFATPGIYTITMEVANRCGVDTVIKTICVEGTGNSSFTIDTNIGCAPLPVAATNTTNISGLCEPTYNWTISYANTNCGTVPPANYNYFTNGTNASSANPTFNFPNSGTYTISLAVTNSCGTVTSTKTVTVKRPPTVNISGIPSVPICAGAPFTPVAAAGNCAAQPPVYSWSFPGGTPSTSANANAGPVSYSAPGTYTITLEVTNECGTTTETRSITINPTPTVNAIANQEKCKGQQLDAVTFSGNLPNTTYNWTNSHPAIGLPASGSGNINPLALQNNTPNPITAIITVTPSINGCSGAPQSFTVTVNPQAVVSNVTDKTLCNGATQPAINFSSTSSNVTYNWTNSDATIGLAANGTGSIASFTAVNAGTMPVTATITIIPVVNGCPGIAEIFTIKVNPAPLPLVLTDKEFCKGVATTAINFTNAVAGTTYTWTNSNTAIGLSGGGTGNIPSFTPANNGTAPITATITVTPSANGCSSASQTFTITVYPSPVVTFSMPNQTLCSGENTAEVTLNSTTAGVTFNWTAVQPAGITGVVTSGTGIIPVHQLTNTTNAPISVTYKATASVAGGGPTCAGAEFNYTVTVKPKPLVIQQSATICSGASFNITPVNGAGSVVPANTTYTWSAPSVSPAGTVTGASAQATALPGISQTLTNTSNTTATVTYTVTPFANGCAGEPFNVVITVNAQPSMNAVSNVEACNGMMVSAINFDSVNAATTYTWTNSNPAIGLSSAGNANIPSFTAINATGTSVTATITVTPKVGVCTGTPVIFTITVNPAPTIAFSQLNQTVCSGGISTPVNVTSNTANTTITWTATEPVGITGVTTAGTTSIPAQTLINSTSAPITVSYIAMASTTTGAVCSGSQFTYTITVNPVPIVTAQTAEACSSAAFTVIPANGGGNSIPSGTTYTWSAPAGTGFTGGSAQGTPQSAISQTLTNTTSTVVTATYTVIPKVNNCTGAPFTVTVTVLPKPVIANQAISICSGENFTVNPDTIPGAIVPAGVTFTWGAPVITGGITGGNAGTAQSSISGILLNPVNIPHTAIYTVTPVSPAGVCNGASFTITVTVIPSPSITTTPSQTICSGGTFSIIPANAADGIVPANTTYTWGAPDISPVGAITGSSAQAAQQTAISQSLINTTNTVATATYTVTPKSGNCEGDTFEVIINVNPVPAVNDITNQTLCNGAPSALIPFTGYVTGTVYNWTNNTPSIGLGANGTGDIPSFIAQNLTTAPVTATITVTPSINGCAGTAKTFTIKVNPAPTVAFSQPAQTICSSTASTAVTLTSATPGTTITWSAVQPAGVTGVVTNGTTTIPAQTLINTTSTPVTVTYTAVASTSDSSACPGPVASYQIVVTPVPFVNEPIVHTICSGNTFNIIPPDGTPNNIPPGTTFTWSAPAGTGFTGGSAQSAPQTSIAQTLVNTTISPVIATYIVTPAFNNCAGVPFTITVTVNPAAVINNSAATICNNGSFSINPAANATVLPANTTYSWNAPVVTGGVTGGAPGIGATIVSGTLVNPTNATQTATYTVTPISPAGNCAGAMFTITITVKPSFTVTGIMSNFNGFEISTADAADGWIDITPAGGSGAYTYSWTGPAGFTATTQDTNNLGEGSYSVTIADGLCDPVTLTFQIDAPLPLVIAEVLPSHNNVNCFGQTTGIIKVEITQASIAPFDYVIALTNGTVVETVTNTNDLSYVFDNLAAGTYNITVTDANGTVKTLNGIVITQPAAALAITNSVVSAFNGFSISCNGAQNGSIDITVNGGSPAYTYSWTGPAGFSAATQDISGLAPGVYTVVINDTSGICTITQAYTITEPQPLAITSVLSNFNGFQISCFGGNNGSINITPTGGTGNYVYQWTGPGTFTSSAQDLSGLVAGTYQLNLTDSNGCALGTQIFTLTQPASMTINESHANVLCFGAATGSVTVTVNGGVPVPAAPDGYNFAWSGPNGFVAATKDITNIEAGLYTLTVTDNSGCSINLTVTITQQPDIIITPTTTPITCFGANNASISLAISGGDAPYTAEWSNLATGTFQDNLAAGLYTITVTDASSCTKVISVNIPEAPVFTVNPVFSHISCNGANDGSISLNLTGGIAPVTLTWNDGSTAGTTRNNLAPGTYTATILDGTPCQIVRTFVIVEPQRLNISANLTHATDCDNTMSGAINLHAAGGTPPYNYSWSNGAVTEDLTGITSGNYAVTVTDANGCIDNKQFVITRQEPMALSVAEEVVFNCNTASVRQINVATASGGVPPFQYTWSTGTTSGSFGQIMQTNQNGTVICTATDAEGCTVNFTFDIQTEQLGEASFTAESYAMGTYGIYSIIDPIQFTNTSTGDFIEVSWDFGDGSISNEENPLHSYLREGTYIVKQIVTYPYGCVSTNMLTVVIEKGYDVMIPNGFTPNSDGINDLFNTQHRGLRSIELNVYDTWGSLLYSEKGETLKGWDGMQKGTPSENGNYVYKVVAETFYGHIHEYTAPFTLLK